MAGDKDERASLATDQVKATAVTTPPTTTTTTQRNKKKEPINRSKLGPEYIAPDGGHGWLVALAAGCSNVRMIQCLSFRSRECQLIQMNIWNRFSGGCFLSTVALTLDVLAWKGVYKSIGLN